MDFEDDMPRLVAETPPGDNSAPVTVSELAGRLKRLVEGEFGHVRLRGEISGWKRAASGHAYLSLKDENAVIDAVMWKGQVTRIPFAAQDGIEVIATGKLTTYPGRSKYQLVVETLELAGEGALMQLFERLKVQLDAEGLFAKSRARAPLPFMPATIGVVTSSTGAVIRDILHRLADRCPCRVVVWPVKVQGDGSAVEIAAAVRGFDTLPVDGPVPRPDLVIVARGGGSIEDLWAFNEEAVVRAVAACTIPVISAVGHETDTTLCDFAADLRAPTPTAAAELAVPVKAELSERIASLALRTDRCQRRYRERARERLDALVRVLPRRDALLGPQRQRVDDAAARLGLALERRAGIAQRELDRVSTVLRVGMLDRAVTAAQARLAGAERLLASLHPGKPLDRGYAWVGARTTGKVIDSAAAARVAQSLTLHFRDGAVDAQVGANADTPAVAKGRPKLERGAGKAYAGEEPAQPNLL